MMLNIDEVKEIIKMVDQSSIQRFEIEYEATKMIIVKNDVKSAIVDSLARSAVVLPRPGQDEPVPEKIAQESQEESLYKIISPIIGTFYSASEPGDDPFVKIGQIVHLDTVVCVLESMKLFNEVEAGTNGEIVDIMVKDGEFVEYGQPLFLVKPS